MAYIDDINGALRLAAIAAGQLEAERATLEARVAELEGEVDPPIIVEPPDPPVPVPGAPDYSQFAFAHLMPRFPAYTRPTEADCDWVLDRTFGYARSRRGLADIVWDALVPGIAGACFRASRAAGHGARITIGVLGKGGLADVGGFYSGTSPQDVCRALPDGSWEAIDVQFVGLTPDAEIQVRWGGPTWDVNFGRTTRLACFGIGIVGYQSNHAFTQNRDSYDGLILDDFWILPPEGHAVDWHAGFHIANWHTLVLRNMKRKGRNGAAPPKFTGHVPYLKSSSKRGSSTWVINCDLRGANMTGVQRRPGTDEPYLQRPQDAIVYDGNVIDGYGWDHTNEGGGAAISHWAGKQAFIVRNKAEDVRYGGLVVSGQPLYNGHDRNWYDADGYPIGDVYIAGNKFSNPRSLRHAVSISNAARVYLDDTNDIGGTLCLESQWIHTLPPAMPRSRVKLIGARSKFGTPVTFDADHGGERPMTENEVQAMHVATWAEALG